jgi:hypothetical protein
MTLKSKDAVKVITVRTTAFEKVRIYGLGVYGGTEIFLSLEISLQKATYKELFHTIGFD